MKIVLNVVYLLAGSLSKLSNPKNCLILIEFEILYCYSFFLQVFILRLPIKYTRLNSHNLNSNDENK